jgi:hypothetical protein
MSAIGHNSAPIRRIIGRIPAVAGVFMTVREKVHRVTQEPA